MLSEYERLWRVPVRVTSEDHGDLVFVQHVVAEGLDEVALACLRQVLKGEVGAEAVPALERARDVIHEVEKAHEKDEPFPMVTAWRDFPFNIALSVLNGRPISYEVLAHSRSAARLYAFRALWLFREQCDVEAALPLLFKNIADTLGFVAECMGVARALLPSDDAFFERAAAFVSSDAFDKRQFEGRIKQAREEKLLPQFQRTFVEWELPVMELAGREARGRELVTCGWLDEAQLESALNTSYQTHRALEDVAMSLGYLTPQIDLDSADLASVLGEALLPVFLLLRYRFVPVRLEGERLQVAMESLQPELIEDLRLVTGYTIEPLLASREGVSRALGKLFPEG